MRFWTASAFNQIDDGITLQWVLGGWRVWGHAGAGVSQVSGGGFVGSGEGEAEAGHVVVDALVLTGGDLVGLVPDAYGSVAADVLVESLPCGEVCGVAGLGVVDEVVEGAPVLSDYDPGHVEGGESAEEAEFGFGVELAKHGAHGFCGGKPFAKGEETIDTKAYKKDDKGPVDMRGESTCVDGGHLG
jgi:hypothetical protein